MLVSIVPRREAAGWDVEMEDDVEEMFPEFWCSG
jgi:hypothetical protein